MDGCQQTKGAGWMSDRIKSKCASPIKNQVSLAHPSRKGAKEECWCGAKQEAGLVSWVTETASNVRLTTHLGGIVVNMPALRRHC